MELRSIPLALIYGNPDQPRKTFGQVELHELAASIRQNGLKQPITVRDDGAGRFMIVMGERRFRAHELIDGCTEILAHVSTVDDRQLAVDAIIENDQRVDVSPLEQARAYQRMIDEFGYDAQSLAVKLGKDVHRITERLELLKLTPELQVLLASGALTALQAWYVAKVPAAQQSTIVRAINSGQCTTHAQLRTFIEALTDTGQSALFELVDATPEEKRTASSVERRIEAAAAMLRSAIDNNEVIAVRRVNPDRAGYLADLLHTMIADVRRVETAFRVAAAASATE